MVLDRIRIFLSFYDLCCFNTGLTEITSTQRRTGVIFLLHISFALFYVYVNVRFYHYFCALLGFLSAINELVEFSGSIFTYWLIIIDSFLYRNTHRQFWLHIQRIEMDKSLPGMFTFYLYKIKFIEFFAVSTAGILYTFLHSVERFVIYLVYNIPVRICQIRVFYYMLCLEIAQLQLKQIEHEMNRVNSVCLAENGRTRLKQIREKLQLAYETTELLNTIFNWSQVAAVAYCFFSIFTDSNYLYVHGNEITILDSIGKHPNH